MVIAGIPLDFFLFGLTLLGVALFHHHTLNPTGQVRIQGELWGAESVDGKIAKDSKITVTKIHGLLLNVKKT